MEQTKQRDELRREYIQKLADLKDLKEKIKKKEREVALEKNI